MSTTIQDGSGKGYQAKIDNENRMFTRSVNSTEFDVQTIKGLAYNINTEHISVSVGTETPILYLKNNDNNVLVLANFFSAIGIQGAAPTALPIFRIYINPTGGTLLSGGTDVIAVNRLIGSFTELNATIKKGNGSTSTVTGYDATPLVFQTQNTSSRNFGSLQIALLRGSSAVVTVQLNGAQSAEVYSGFQCYIDNGSNS